MVFLTDNPDATASFLPSGAVWRGIDVGALAPSDGALWAVFGHGRACWRCVLPVPDGFDGPYANRRWVLMDAVPDSQFNLALAALKADVDVPDGLICIALEGTGFRGQRDRPWQAWRGNLHLTAHYRLGLPASDLDSGLTMLPAVASASAIRNVTGGAAPARIKWVNDILLDGRKVSGVLTATHVLGQLVERVVFGIGMNVAVAPDLEPTPYVPAAGSLAGFDLSLPLVLQAVVSELDRGVEWLRRGRVPRLFDEYLSLADFLGREVSIWPEQCEDRSQSEPIARGRVLGLWPDLSLDISGINEPVRRGRMAYI